MQTRALFTRVPLYLQGPWRMLLAFTLAIGVHTTLFLIWRPTDHPPSQISASLMREPSMEVSLIPSHDQALEMSPVDGEQEEILSAETAPPKSAIATTPPHISPSSSVRSSRSTPHQPKTSGRRTAKAAGYLYAPRPPYPPLSRQSGHMGLVLLSVIVDQQGKVSTISVMKSSGYVELDQQALRTVRDRWRFKPAMKYSVPVATEVVVPIRFSLGNRL
jgi:protein TonB